ncbi:MULTISPECIES: DUF5684 domain-containing protein [Halobacterium]|uniref:DUF5684 domain-containing protein n=1 Tax=Halobacterium TaxID=2239 RepID=UPI00073F052F|nr:MULTISPECIES: DUF5684 domain-containing protein [Halobacterium]MCG1003534.1 DUF5684 domain-containing protein [Halobacterium noricense]
MTFDSFLLPLQSSAGDAIGGLFALLFALVVLVAVVGGTWMTFSKAGEPGWAAIIPIYNLYVMLKIGGNEWWWLLLFLVPIVNIFVAVKMFVDIARSFGFGVLFGIGLWLLPVVFFPVLGFGDYEYHGPGGRGPGASGQLN